MLLCHAGPRLPPDLVRNRLSVRASCDSLRESPRLASFWCEMVRLADGLLVDLAPRSLVAGDVLAMLLAGGQRKGSGAQIGGDHAPTDPTAEAILAVVTAPTEVSSALEHADPPLHPSPKAHGTAKPPLPLVILSFSTLRPRFGQGNLSHPRLRKDQLVLRRVNAAVTRKQIGRTPEEPLVVGDARGHLAILGRVTHQHPVAADDPAIDLVQPDLVPKLGRLADLAPADDLAVRLEETHQLLERRHRLAIQYPPTRLSDHLLEEGHELPKPTACLLYTS